MAGPIDPAWLVAQLEGAPQELAARAREFVAVSGGAVDPATLAAAGRRALDQAVRSAPDRRAALDLLAADALVTLALAAAVETMPDRLAEFASALRRAESSPS
jgi:hypothetical protein